MARIPGWLAGWYTGIFAIGHNWHEQLRANLPALGGPEMEKLQMLASHLDHVGLNDQLSQDSISAIHDALAEADALIRAEPTIPADARRYMLALVAQARWLLDNHAEYGAAVLRRACHELAGALTATAESGRLPSDRVSKWQKAAAALAVQVILPTASGIASGVTSAAIESGSAMPIIVQVDLPPDVPAATADDDRTG